MSSNYNWQQSDWPHFQYNQEALVELLHEFANKSSYANGLLTAMLPREQEAARLQVLVAEAIKTSEIEGEFLSRKDVYSSIQYNLGITGAPKHIADHRAAGISALVVDVRNTFADPLTDEALWRWHSMLFGDARHPKMIGG